MEQGIVKTEGSNFSATLTRALSITLALAVVGDTAADPFKDTSGPSLNILIKLMSMVSVVFAGLIVKYAPIIGDWPRIGSY